MVMTRKSQKLHVQQARASNKRRKKAQSEGHAPVGLGLYHSPWTWYRECYWNL